MNTRSQFGAKNHRWRGGVHLHVKGYLRYSSGEHRNKMVHRVVLEKLMGRPIPENMTVEHLDHNKQHNCIENLMLLAKEIHDYLSLRTAALRAGDVVVPY